MQTLHVSDAANRALFCEALECHRQIWQYHNSSWEGYVKEPRFADGLMLVCSPIRVKFCDETGRILLAEQGDVIYAPQGIRYRVDFENGGGEPDLYTVNFRLKTAQGEPIRLGDSLCRLSAMTPEVRLITEELYGIFLYPNGNAWHRHAKLLELLAAVADAADDRCGGYGKIDAGVRLLQSEWNQNHRVERYARACGMSESGFYRYFKEWSGLSPNDYRIHMRIEAARSMLQNSTLEVQEIAYRVGFADPYYFSRCFCRLTGGSPSAFRKRVKTV
jgi:AraC-like DNA-binding protein